MGRAPHLIMKYILIACLIIASSSSLVFAADCEHDIAALRKLHYSDYELHMGIVENISPLGAREQISLQTFALLLGVSEGDVIDIFRGQRELTATQILRLAKFFDVKVEDILVPQKLKTFHPPSLDPANLEKALQYVHAGFANTREQYEFPYADEIKIAIAGVENLQPNSSVETVVSAVRAHMDKLNQEDALRHAKK